MFNPTAHAATTVRSWTVMVYMNAKNNLEPFALDNFHDMAQTGGSQAVNIVVELGRPEKQRYTSADGDWSGVYRFVVHKDESPIPKEAVAHVAAPYDDMGKPSTLRAFIEWAKTEYPANHYMLVVWNHGQGWRFQMARYATNTPIRSNSQGSLQSTPVPPTHIPTIGGFRAVSADADTGSILYNSQVEEVISETFSRKRLDVLGFDACLMGMIESAYAFAPHTVYMVASEELEPGDGWPYSDWLRKLEARPAMSPKDLAKSVVSAYEQRYGNTYLTTMSAVDLNTLRAEAKKFSDFSRDVERAGTGEIAALKAARDRLQSYGQSVNPPLRTSVDLLSLLQLYEERTHDVVLRDEAKRLCSGIAAEIVANYASSRSSKPVYGPPYGSEGLAIYFPRSIAAFKDDGFHRGYMKANRDRPVAFVEDTYWPELMMSAIELKQ